MKKVVFNLMFFLFILFEIGFAQHHGGMMNSGKEKDPSTAALLSIQPLPVALGNFYAGNWSRGIIYTAAELALFIPTAVLLGRNDWHMGMHNDYYDSNEKSWSNGERTAFYSLLTAYVLVKIASAFDAGLSVEKFNEQVSMNYNRQTKSAMLKLNFPLR